MTAPWPAPTVVTRPVGRHRDDALVHAVELGPGGHVARLAVVVGGDDAQLLGEAGGADAAGGRDAAGR